MVAFENCWPLIFELKEHLFPVLDEFFQIHVKKDKQYEHRTENVIFIIVFAVKSYLLV
jgi:hypothetical protein